MTDLASSSSQEQESGGCDMGLSSLSSGKKLNVWGFFSEKILNDNITVNSVAHLTVTTQQTFCYKLAVKYKTTCFQ